MSVDLVGHLTYILILSQYLVRDMLKLRVLAILASLCSIGFTYYKGVYLVTKWNLVFLAVNAVQLSILLYERRPIAFAEEEEKLRELVFQNLEPAELRRLLDRGTWGQAGPGELLVHEGELMPRLMLVHSGHGVVKVKGKIVGEVKPGFFVGEMAYLSDAPASAVVEVDLPVTYIAWEREPLKEFLGSRPALASAFQGVLGADLLKKIRKASGLRTTAGTIPLEEITQHG